MEPDIRRRLTCWPAIGFIESSIGRLGIFSLTTGASFEMKNKLQDRVLGKNISEIDFVRAATPFICFPVGMLREGKFRPSKTVLSAEQCGHLSQTDLLLIARLYIGENSPSTPVDCPISVFASSFSQKWLTENKKAAAETRKELIALGRQIQILAADGVDINGLSSEQLFRLIRKSAAFRTYERFLEILTFAMHGWFIDSHMTVSYIREAAAVMRGLSRQAGEANGELLEEFHSQLVQHYDSRYEDIKASVIRQFSKRSDLLIQAFTAHEKGMYSLAIPVFIAQADGIYREEFGMPLFERFRSKSNPGLARVLESLKKQEFHSHEITWSDYLPLVFYFTAEGVIPFKEPVVGRMDCSRPSFSRHAIVHGLTTAYGTHENSLRYISLLNYLAWNS
jgi:hypothetical protein